MFDDLICDLTQKNLDTYAYADDLAVNGQSEENKKETIKIIEEWASKKLMKKKKKK